MGINKVQYGNTTLIDLTSDTVTADKLMQGYTAHDRSGALITGTATGGGSVTQDQDGFIVLPPDRGGSPSVGGLEYETGTWTPSEDVAQPTINFTNTHSTPPRFAMMVDVSDDLAPENSNAYWSIDYWDIDFNHGLYHSGTTLIYARTTYGHRITGTSLSFSGTSVTNRTSETEGGSYLWSWVRSTCIRPSSNSTSRYWRAGRTYKWIAVWAPTT